VRSCQNGKESSGFTKSKGGEIYWGAGQLLTVKEDICCVDTVFGWLVT